MDSHLTHLDTAAAGLALGAAAAGGATALLSVVGRGLAREGAPADEPNLRSAVCMGITKRMNMSLVSRDTNR